MVDYNKVIFELMRHGQIKYYALYLLGDWESKYQTGQQDGDGCPVAFSAFGIDR